MREMFLTHAAEPLTNDMTDNSASPLFSILIPTWNNLEMLKLCVRSIESNSSFPHEILVHVNDDSDGTLDWVREMGIRHTHSSENIGVCWALNRLRSLVSSDYMVFINDDMYMCPGWDKAYLDEIKAVGHNKFFLASTTIQPLPHNLRPIGVPVADYGRSVGDFDEDRLLGDVKNMNVPDTMGAVWPPNIVHRDMWDLVGGYSIEYTPGLGSDPDFSAKLWMAGVRYFKTMGTSLCYHFMSASVNRVKKNVGHLQFLRKWGITPRVFLRDFLNVDTAWDGALGGSGAKAGFDKELARCGAKKVLTVLQDSGASKLWDPPFGQIE